MGVAAFRLNPYNDSAVTGRLQIINLNNTVQYIICSPHAGVIGAIGGRSLSLLDELRAAALCSVVRDYPVVHLTSTCLPNYASRLRTPVLLISVAMVQTPWLT